MYTESYYRARHHLSDHFPTDAEVDENYGDYDYDVDVDDDNNDNDDDYDYDFDIGIDDAEQ